MTKKRISMKIFIQNLDSTTELRRYKGAIHYYRKIKRWLSDDRDLALGIHRRKCCKGVKSHFRQH
jgi:uncharacterized protein YlbG (UPF0298 family)